jgi:hypothetical protein
MNAVTYQLTMRSGPTPGKSFELAGDEIKIGRDPGNDISIKDPEISRVHARLLAQAEGYVIEDLGSTNGTFVNGQRLIGPHLLKPGELVLFAENVSYAFEEYIPEQDATMISEPAAAPLPPTEIDETPPVPPPPQDLAPQPVSQAEPKPSFPVEPEMAPSEPPPLHEEPPPKSNTGLYVGCGCLIVMLCLLVGSVYVVDTLNLWCYGPLETIWTDFGFVCK